MKNSKHSTNYLKRVSSLILIGLFLFSVFMAYRASNLKFDYEFENFFPKDNQKLDFFKKYRSTFESDNDFVLIAIQNKNGIFQKNFLDKAQVFTEELRLLPHIRSVISPLEASYYNFSPSSFGNAKEKFFHPDEIEHYQQDSIRLAQTKWPIANMISFQNNSFLILLKNDQMISKKKSDELANALHQLIDRQNFDDLHFMGKVIGQKAYVETLKKEFILFMVISCVLLILILIITYRSLWGVLIPMATVLLALVGSLGIMQISGYKLNMLTTLLPVIMLVVGMSDVIHLMSKYLEVIRLGKPKVEAVKLMLRKVGIANLLTSLTTALGFITLVWISIPGIQSFGLFTAIGVIVAFVLSILFIPSLFLLLPTPKIAKAKQLQSQWQKQLGKIFLKLFHNRKSILIFYGILTVLSIYGASKIKFDYFLMQDLGESQELMQDLRYFQANYGGIRPFEMAILPKEDFKVTDYVVMQELGKLESYLDSNYGVHQLISPTLPFKMANYVLRDSRSEYFIIPKKKKRFDYLKGQLEKMGGNKELKSLISPDATIARVHGRLVDPGSAAMLQRNAALKNFYQTHIDTTILGYELTGSPVLVDESSKAVSSNVFYGLLIAFLIIALLMGFLFKSIKIAIYALIPNIFPILLCAGIIGFLGISLSMSTAIVFTIAFGIAVDDTIHFLSRYHQELKGGKSQLFALRRTYVSAGKAMVISTLVLLGGFVSLLFSDFQTTFYIGFFIFLILIFALITDLTLLPILLLGKEKRS